MENKLLFWGRGIGKSVGDLGVRRHMSKKAVPVKGEKERFFYTQIKDLCSTKSTAD